MATEVINIKLGEKRAEKKDKESAFPNSSALLRSKRGIKEEKTMAEEGQVISCHTVESWTQQLQAANESKKLVVVDFTASWCAPCRFIAPVLAELAKKLTNVIFLKVDVDELKNVAQDWAIEAMPTFIFLKEGTIVDKVVGARKDELNQKIALHSSSSSAAVQQA